jgi:hypothetical protein
MITHKKKRPGKYDIITRVINECQAIKIQYVIGAGKRRKIWLDLQTAHSIKRLIDAAPPENKTKIENMPWDRLCSIAWDTQS